ncbi:MAG: phosphatase PAP2 family protein [Bacteroidota bacterium]
MGIFVCLLVNPILGQFTRTETNPKGSFIKRAIVPTSLILGGALLSGSSFERNLQSDLRNELGSDFFTEIDDYTRFAPIAQMYIADLAGVKAKNHWFDQTKHLTISVVVNQILTGSLKRITKKQRPDGSSGLKSWPSGHTSLAFVSATVLYEEFKEESPILAYSGYVFAGATGFLRMANNRHWLSDVLAGAGLGILVTKLVYEFDGLFSWNPFLKSKDITFAPNYNEGALGFYFSKKF